MLQNFFLTLSLSLLFPFYFQTAQKLIKTWENIFGSVPAETKKYLKHINNHATWTLSRKWTSSWKTIIDMKGKETEKILPSWRVSARHSDFRRNEILQKSLLQASVCHWTDKRDWWDSHCLRMATKRLSKEKILALLCCWSLPPTHLPWRAERIEETPPWEAIIVFPSALHSSWNHPGVHQKMF